MAKRLIFALLLTAAMAVPTGAQAHEGEGGEPGHWDTDDGVEAWHTHGLTPEEQTAQRKYVCEAERAKRTRQADAWNRREAAAWAQLQEACADESPAGRNRCKNRHRMYQGNYSTAATADFEQYLLSSIAEACRSAD